MMKHGNTRLCFMNEGGGDVFLKRALLMAG